MRCDVWQDDFTFTFIKSFKLSFEVQCLAGGFHFHREFETFRIGFLLRRDVWQEDFTLRQRWLS